MLDGVDALVFFGLYQEVLQQLPRCAHEFDMHEITVAQSGDLAVVSGSYRFTPDAQAPADVQSGKFVGVWRRRDDDWRLQLNISNASG